MSCEIITTDNFAKEVKTLSKRHRSLPDDVNSFVDRLSEGRERGVNLSPNVFKYRMAITSKGCGKSGGARIVTYEVLVAVTDDMTVWLLKIYDKSNQSSVSDSEIEAIRRAEGLL